MANNPYAAVPSSPEQIIKVILLKRNLDNLIY